MGSLSLGPFVPSVTSHFTSLSSSVTIVRELPNVTESTSISEHLNYFSFGVVMAEKEVPVYCYWNGCIKYGTEGVYYEGSTPKTIIVKGKIAFNRLLDEMYLLTGLEIDKQRSKVIVFGRYPSVLSESVVKYLLLPVVNDASLETMLEVPRNHPDIKNVELYLEVKSDGVIVPAACPSKRRRTDIPVKLERDNSNGWTELIEDGADADNGNDIEGDMTEKDVGAQVVNLNGDSSISDKDLDEGSTSGVSKPALSGLWIDDHDLRLGLCFKDADELKKAVNWCSIRGQQKCVVQETGKDACMIECIRWKCKWSLEAARKEKHGFFEIIKYTGPHTCRPLEPEDPSYEFEADEIERVVRVQPTQSYAELKKWWKEKFSYELETSEVQVAKREAIKRVCGDWDKSFEDLPKLMAAFQLSNKLVVDWKYECFPNPKFASFCGVFWAFSQSIEGFPHCRPLIAVDSKALNAKYPMTLMIASGVDAAGKNFPLAFAVTKEASLDSWRWFLTKIREKVTQRKGICVISSPHPDICAVINEPGSRWKEPWAYHRFCLNHLCSHFHGIFRDSFLESLIKKAAVATQKEEYDSYMMDIKKRNPEARKWLDQFPPNQWALAHDRGQRYGFMNINTVSLFAVFRVDQLADHVLTGYMLLLFDELRHSFDEYSDFTRSYFKSGDVYVKAVMDKLDEFRTVSVTYDVLPLDNNAFQVTTPLDKNGWTVQLSDCTCTCGIFQNFKFPCQHALAVCKKLKINPLQYVDDCYTLERFNKTYAATFSPVPELSAWPEAPGVPRLFPPVIATPPPPPQKVSGKFQHKATTKKR